MFFLEGEIKKKSNSKKRDVSSEEKKVGQKVIAS